MLKVLISAFVLLGAAACDCGGGALVTTGDDHTMTPTGPQMVAPTAPTSTTPPGWCGNDCDCATGSVCVSGAGELSQNSCQPGTNTCPRPCATVCGTGTTCTNGVCVAAPCLDASCMMTTTPPGGVSVAGTYNTFYEFDVHEFAEKAAEIDGLLNVLSAALSGNAMCGSQSTPSGQLICIAISLIAQNIHAPPWVQQLITVLSGVFKFGDSPVTAQGVMQLAEASDGTLTAGENWSQMWLEYNGMQYNVMSSPSLGSNGNITVTVKAFGGTRTTNEVILGPRDINFDVNKLLVNLINVAISAGSNNQAQDVGGLLDLVLCNQIPIASSDYLICTAAATQLAQQFELDSGLGGIHLSEQRGLIYDNNNDGLADSFGQPMPVSSRGSVLGDMSNGLVDGDLGPFPASNWYGTRQ